MALATRCPNCHALFRVAADQLKLRGGLVRCGACRHVFDATGTLSYIDDASLSTSAHAAAPAVGAVIAAIRKAESNASESPAMHDQVPLPAAPAQMEPGPQTQTSAEPAAEVAAQADADHWVGPPSQVPTAPAFPAPVDAADRAGLEPSVDQGPAAELPALDEALPVADQVTPAFLREADAQRARRRSVLFGIGALLLAGLVLAQLAVAFRAELLVRIPQARPALTALCKVFRCTVNWPARGELLAVVGSELQALPGTGALELTAVIRNRGSMTLALPAIELTLSDTLNRTVARRVFAPSEYLAGEDDPQARLLTGLDPGADLTVRIAFEAQGLNAAGFVVYPFYL